MKMTKTEFNKIRDDLLDKYDWETASSLMNLTKIRLEYRLRKYYCPIEEDREPEALKKMVKDLFNHLYDSNEFGKSDVSVSTGRFVVDYWHGDDGDFEIEIHLDLLSASYSKNAEDDSEYVEFD